MNVHEIGEGVIYEDTRVKVDAFLVKHGALPDAYGFRFTTIDMVIVISGDTAPCDSVIEYASGADILVHEVYSQQGFARKTDAWRGYHSTHHTSTRELAEIANIARPKLLVLYHVLFWGASEQEILDEIALSYPGKTILGTDLQVIA